jgi:hypothetical protein
LRASIETAAMWMLAVRCHTFARFASTAGAGFAIHATLMQEHGTVKACVLSLKPIGEEVCDQVTLSFTNQDDISAGLASEGRALDTLTLTYSLRH